MHSEEFYLNQMHTVILNYSRNPKNGHILLVLRQKVIVIIYLKGSAAGCICCLEDTGTESIAFLLGRTKFQQANHVSKDLLPSFRRRKNGEFKLERGCGLVLED